jgi:hypothetical protein
LVVVLAGLGGWASQARAGTVEGLYEAAVRVSGQDDRERDRALREGLLEVVLRVSGQRRIPPTGVISAALREPSRFVQESAFRTAGGGRQLWARFDPTATNELLRQAGLPAWGASRPTTLVWVAVERGEGRVLQGAGEPNAATAALEARARVRGLPVRLPALDAEDRARVRVDDVWNDATERVVAASRRYGADAVLLGHARERLQGLWESRWTLVAGDQTERYNVDAEQLETAVGEALDRAVDLLAARHARVQLASVGAPAGAAAGVPRGAAAGAAAGVPPGAAAGAATGLPPGAAAGAATGIATGAAVDDGPLPELVVTGVGSLETYGRALRALQGVEGVTAVRLVRLDPGRAVFRVAARSNRGELSRLIAQGGALAPAGSAGEWTFQLVP